MSVTEEHRAKLTEPVQFLKGVGPSRAELLQKLGLRTASDVLFFFPRRYQDFTEQKSIFDLEIGEQASVVGTVNDIDHSNANGRRILNVLLAQPNGGFLRAVWFNQDHMMNRFRFGQTVQFRGKVTERGGRKQMTHPSVIWVEDGTDIPDGQLLPVYSLTDGISQNQMRKIVSGAIEDYAELVEESFPESLRASARVCDIQTAIQHIHAPENEAQSLEAQRRLVYQELLILQLAVSMRRHKIEANSVATPLELSPKIKARILGRMPFELTQTQRAVFEEIAADMNRNYPMNRLLHGEVGSGKTIVAICAMMLAIAQENQAVLMAPTEILAQQHFDTISSLLKQSRVKVALWTGSLKPNDRTIIGAAIAEGKIDIVVGTTAVVESKLTFGKLGLVVIDEQHKFGVRQRSRLKQSGFDPHYLVMTATPIPRTVTMTLFGDLDVSVLERRASTAKKINTYLGDKNNRDNWWDFFRSKIDQGRQGFVVAPLVAGIEESDVQSAERLFESLSNGPLEAYRLGLLHGRHSTEEKMSTMRQFNEGAIQVLVATGVIEVGIDVPNATVMTIESAERFGLSQLHQLRGRVGRGQHPGFVCAFATSKDSAEIERLRAFEATDNGFELAQIDLQIRGPGNLFSTEQTGFPPLRIADLIRDGGVLQQAHSDAREMIALDPDLAAPDMRRLRELVLTRYGKTLDISDVG